MENKNIKPTEFRRKVLEDIVNDRISDWPAYYAMVHNLYRQMSTPEWLIQLSLCLEDLKDMIITPYMEGNGYTLRVVDGEFAWVYSYTK